jgi:hypothetical protein
MKYLITQSLIASLQRSLESGDMSDFMDNLNRLPTEENEYMRAGKRFEAMVMQAMDPCAQPSKETANLWACAQDFAEITKGGTYQASLYREIVVEGMVFLVHGKPDCIKAGVIYDYKYSEGYTTGKQTKDGYQKPKILKYQESPQASFYFYLVPGSRKFIYLICDGEWNYTETYHPEEVEPITSVIRGFIRYLEKTGLLETYKEKWRTT